VFATTIQNHHRLPKTPKHRCELKKTAQIRIPIQKTEMRKRHVPSCCRVFRPKGMRKILSLFDHQALWLCSANFRQFPVVFVQTWTSTSSRIEVVG
jgi:hypothetical protein